MSTEFGNQQLATKIQKSKHAGEAKRLSKDIPDDEKRWQWEKDNIEVMKELLSAKAKQCQEFLNCLMENKDNLLAEATPSKFWGTGMSLFVTKNCSPRYWLGKNMLGALLSELTQVFKGDPKRYLHKKAFNLLFSSGKKLRYF